MTWQPTPEYHARLRLFDCLVQLDRAKTPQAFQRADANYIQAHKDLRRVQSLPRRSP